MATKKAAGKRPLASPEVPIGPRARAKSTRGTGKQRVLPAAKKDTSDIHPNVVYRVEHSEKAYGLCLLGLNNEQLAWSFDVTRSTIDDWAKTYPEFKDALYRGREGADAEVAMSLRRRAIGYTHDSEELKVVAQGDGMGSVVERHKIIKHYPPSEVAAIFWLKNRQKASWKNDPGTGGTDDPQDAARAARQAIAALDATTDGEDAQ